MLLTSSLLLLCLQAGDLADAVREADSLAGGGDFSRAVAVLREAGASDSSDPEILTRLGTFQLRDAEAAAASGRLTGLAVNDAFLEAADTLKRAVALAGAPAEAWENLSEALLNAGDSGHALEAAEDGLGAHPDALNLLLQKGRVLAARAAEQEGREEKQRAAREAAAAVYRHAMERWPESAAAAVRYGEMQVYLGHRETAIDAWREALRRNVAAVDVSVLGTWLGNEAAADLLAERNAEAPASPLALWFQAFYEYYAQRWPQAREHFQEAMELDASFTSSWYFLGEGAMAEGTRLHQAGETEAAAREWAFSAHAWAEYLRVAGAAQVQTIRGMEDGGESFIANIQWLVGRALEARDGRSAVALARWVTQARPQDPAVWNDLGLILRDTGQAAESLQAYERALALQPDDPQLMNDLAVILHYYLRRDDARAKELYQKAIARAEEILAGPALGDEERTRIATALRDARNNLAKLETGDRRPG